MPAMSGLESSRHIRRHENEHNLEAAMIVALTGAANPRARQEAYASGIDMFLPKPVPMKELKAILEDLSSNCRPDRAA